MRAKKSKSKQPAEQFVKYICGIHILFILRGDNRFIDLDAGKSGHFK